MKRSCLLVFMLLSAVLLLAACGTGINPSQELNTVSVTGEATGTIKPDVAYLNVSIHAEDQDSEKAKQRADELANQVYKDLEAIGIKKEEIETINFYSNEIRDYRALPVVSTPAIHPEARGEGVSSDAVIEKALPNPVVGHSVTNTIKVTINDLDKVTDVVNVVSGKKNVNVGSLNFDLKDKEKLKQQVIEDAIENAKEQAEVVAESLGVKVKGVHKVQVNNSNTYFPSMTARSAVMEMDAATSTPISPEGVDVYATVNVTFIIE